MRLRRRCRVPGSIIKRSSWVNRVGIYAATCPAQLFPVGSVSSCALRAIGELAPAAWAEATSRAKRGPGCRDSEDLPAKRAEGRRGGEAGGGGDVTIATFLLLAKLRHASQSKRMRQRAGETIDFRARGPPRALLRAAAALCLTDSAAALGGCAACVEGEKKKFREFFAKYVQSAEPTAAGKRAPHYRCRKHGGRRNAEVGGTAASSQGAAASHYDQAGAQAREIPALDLNRESLHAAQLAGPGDDPTMHDANEYAVPGDRLVVHYVLARPGEAREPVKAALRDWVESQSPKVVIFPDPDILEVQGLERLLAASSVDPLAGLLLYQ
ncbi:unnamed protein product [Prorocentrum cordatum]|uniref:Uncharacterized protein n=1 Tax=Prorocentrum cordatum TaxID=2364126 RepID=A0ABN9UC92_9DINO|nr:unnamed protein product [Polarella glacialis]